MKNLFQSNHEQTNDKFYYFPTKTTEKNYRYYENSKE